MRPRFHLPAIETGELDEDESAHLTRVLRLGTGDEIDVFDGRGRLIGKISLPEGTRLVGFGKNFVYVARTDADDLQYLQRYPITWTGCAPEIREVCRR